jgi:GAF domain-containing protein
MVSGRTIRPLATTNDIPGIVDAIQSETQQGPCIDAIKEHEVFLTGALSAETRWPEFAHRAHHESGIESILSLRLFAQEDTFGSLNLYSSQADAFDDHDVAVGSVFAAHAGVAMATARHEEQMEARATTRDIIGMAKGMIIARRGVSEDQAFDILRRASQRMNVKLRDVAEQMVRKPEQPAPPAV